MNRLEKQQPETQLQESLNTALFNLESMFNDASLIPLMKVYHPEQCLNLLESLSKAYQVLNIASKSEPIETEIQGINRDIEALDENQVKLWQAIDALTLLNREEIKRKGSPYLKRLLTQINSVETLSKDLKPTEA